MNYLLLAGMFMVLTACTTKDEYYYQTHPQALQEAIKNCPQKPAAHVSCEQLNQVASSINELAYELQVSPQGFGKKILALQNKLAKQQSALHKNPKRSKLIRLTKKSEQRLAEYLAVVRWLESPES